jgi:hypothetical protein
MNKRGSALVIVLVVAVVIIIAVGLWYYYSARQSTAFTPVVTGVSQPNTQPSNPPTLTFVTLLPNSTCPQLTASLSNPPEINSITQFFEPCTIPTNVDAGSFSIVGTGEFGTWAKDKNEVYFYRDGPGQEDGGQIIEIQGADPTSFIAVPSSSGLYYKDINYVYYFADIGGTSSTVATIPGVDAATFTGIGNNYFTDKNSVYYLDAGWNWNKLDGADPMTFEYVGSYANPSGMSYAESVGKDKNCIYDGSNKILNSSGRCLNPTRCTAESLTSNPSSCGLQ